MTAYADFLSAKVLSPDALGFAPEGLPPALMPFQRDLVTWALGRGRAAIFAERGLGKAFMELAWAEQVHRHTGRPVLILAPLAVTWQLAGEAQRFGVEAAVWDGGEALPAQGVVIANYERLPRLAELDLVGAFGGVALDESSILKSFMGRTKRLLVEAFAHTPYRLAATATPSPNDIVELGNHAEFLGLMEPGEMLTRWFINDTTAAQTFRLKAHGAPEFYRWLSTWARALRLPSDLGEYADDGYLRPAPEYRVHTVNTDHSRAAEEDGALFRQVSASATSLHKELRGTLPLRAKLAARIVAEDWACLGNRSTAKTAVSRSKRTPSTGREETPRATGLTPKNGASTTAPGTPRTKSASPSTAGQLPNGATPAGESGTPAIPNTPRSNELPHERLLRQIRERDETRNFGRPSESGSRSTKHSSPHKAESAPSADLSSGTAPADASPLTTATPEATSGDCSAPTAIKVSASSRTTPSGCDELPITSSELEPFVLWCHTNAEQDELEALFGDFAVSIRGDMSSDKKEELHALWISGERPILISKPSIFGWGMNWQHCARTVFVSLNYSFEELYQAVGRFDRYGQARPVQVHLITTDTHSSVLGTIDRKAREHVAMQDRLIAATREALGGAVTLGIGPAHRETVEGDGYRLHNGDCCEVIQGIESASHDFQIFSPPFSNLYSYSPDLRDMGNTDDDAHFFAHFGYLIPQLRRTLRPGRLCAVHVKNLQVYKSKAGYTVLRDFRGETIRTFLEAEPCEDGSFWAYHSEICIWTDPVREMQRTKAHGLLYKNIRQDAANNRQGVAEHVVVFRKWGPGMAETPKVTHDPEEFTLPMWQRYASPVWMDISRTDVLNARIASTDDDEKHLAPLQLEVVRRCVQLWTNPGELVFTPFLGVGSEAYGAIQLGRHAEGIELKPEYFAWAVKNVRQVAEASAHGLFAGVGA